MESYVYIDGKKYKRGYTTGSSAAGAAKAALYMLLNREIIENIEIDTPKGIRLNLQVHKQEIKDDYAIACVKKDGGDDIDATHGLEIYAKVSLDDSKEIKIDGGIGVGRITKKGVGIPVGQAAINKVPRQMIRDSIAQLLPKDKGANVIIYIPRGEEIAKKTFNPRLGIVGGISVIGTTGIVEPMSEEAWKKSLSIELQMKYQNNGDRIIMVPGNHGEEFVKNNIKKDMKSVARTSNFIGYMLNEAKRIGFKKILMAGHLGKFVKIAGGIFHTHSKVADCRMEILTCHMALMGAEKKILDEVYESLTTEAAMEVIEKYGYQDVYKTIAKKAKERVDIYLNDEEIEVGIMLFSMDKEELSRTDNINVMLGEFE